MPRRDFEQGDGLNILVEDDGPGVDLAAATALSERGSRLDEKTPGHGLGLSIVEKIVRLHSGRLGTRKLRAAARSCRDHRSTRL